MSDWLPSMPLERIDRTAVEAFLRAGHQESSLVEYKGNVSTDRLLESVAAMANSYGGVIVVGVPDDWDGDMSRLIGVSEDDGNRLRDRLVDKLDPPWVPPMKLVSPTGGHQLLVVKIDAEAAPQPILCGTRALARYGSRNGPLGVQRLTSLALRERHRPLLPNIGVLQANSTGDALLARPAASPPELLIRLVVGSATWPGQLSSTTPTRALRSLARTSASTSLLQAALDRMASEYECQPGSGWLNAGPANARTLSIGLWYSSRFLHDLRISAHLQTTWAGLTVASGGGVTSSLDVALWPRSAGRDKALQQIRDHAEPILISLDAVHDLLRSIVDALVSCHFAVAGVVCEEIPPSLHIGPVGWVVAAGDVDSYIDVRSLNVARLAEMSLGRIRPLTPPSSTPDNPAAMEDLVSQWCREIVLDLGFDA